MDTPKTLKLVAIDTGEGLLVTEEETTRGHTSYRCVDGYLFDGDRPRPTFHPRWMWINVRPRCVTRMVKQPDVNHRYELVDESMASDRVPLVITRDDAMMEYPDGRCDWRPEFEHLRSLYTHVSDPQPDREKGVDFTFNVIMTLTGYSEPADFVYDLGKGDYYGAGGTVTNNNIQHQLLDEILWPDVVRHLRPCRLSSKDSYDIVRQHVKTHIDLTAAEITSDYDFCFTVMKKLNLAEPYTETVCVEHFRGRRKPKYKNKYVHQRAAEVFEMTYSPKNYGDYTPIPGFEGATQDELKRNIDNYLESLMKDINRPMTECPTCKGLGAVEAKDLTTQED